MNDERFNELALEHILSGLTGAEQIAFERELAERGPAGLREVDRLRESVAAIALTAPPIAPPAGLRERLLDQVADGAESGPSAPVVALPSREPRPDALQPGSRTWLVAAVIASLLAVGLGALNLRLQGDLRQSRLALDSVRVQLASAQAVQARLDDLQGDLITVSSPETNTVTLTGTSEQPAGRARVFIDPLTGRALVFVYDLEVLGPDLVYQLWAIKGSTPADAGVFTVDANGQGRLETADIDVLLDADVMAVTVEPSPGQPSPTGAIVLSS